jgi:hypothetical protein
MSSLNLDFSTWLAIGFNLLIFVVRIGAPKKQPHSAAS